MASNSSQCCAECTGILTPVDSEGLSKIFEHSNINFDELLRSDIPDVASASTAVSTSMDDVESGGEESVDLGIDDCNLKVRTLGGNTIDFGRIFAEMSLVDLRALIAREIGAPPFTVKLLLGNQTIDCNSTQSIRSSGLAEDGSSVVLLRCAADRAEWVQLFHDLVKAINAKRTTDARRLIDQGAGFDGDGKVLRAGHYMRLPGDVTAGHGEPGNTMLHLAIREHLTDLALYLVSCDVDLDATNDVGRSPLVQAVVTRQRQIADALVQARVDLHAADSMGNTALTYALRQNDDHICAQLIRYGVIVKQKQVMCTGICAEVMQPQPQYLHAFSDVAVTFKGSLIKAKVTPFMHACICGMPLTALALLEVGEPINGRDDEGRSALHYAYEHVMPEVVDALLKHGACWPPNQGETLQPSNLVSPWYGGICMARFGCLC